MTNQSTRQFLTHQGLTDEQVIESRNKYGSNVLTPAKREPWYKLLLEKFDDPLIRILLVAAVMAMIVGYIEGNMYESIGIIAAILLATTLGFVNEYKAGKEFDILNQVSDEAPVKVIRNGTYSTAPVKDLVVGDLVLLETGDEVFADGKILEAFSLQVDESKLTGESLAVEKTASETNEGGAVENAYPANEVLKSTLVFDGHGLMQVTAVGDNTEIGKAAKASGEESEEQTPLSLQLDRLGKLISVIAFAVAGLIFLILIIRHFSAIKCTLSQWVLAAICLITAVIALCKVWGPVVADAFELMGKKCVLPKFIEEKGIKNWGRAFYWAFIFFVGAMVLAIGLGSLKTADVMCNTDDVLKSFLSFFMLAVTIIVVAVPEGLPMSVTLSLAYSMRKMTAANNLVRRMHACETIGASSVICSDKTGTLTQNKMQMNAVFFEGLKSNVLSKELKSPIEQLIAESMAVNGTANLSRKESEKTTVLGNPTEGAMLLWLDEAGIDYLPIREGFKLQKQYTFSTETKMMGSFGYSAMFKENIFYVKGAPELILSRCKSILTENGEKELKGFENEIKTELKNSQARGMRTLGFAFAKGLKTQPEGDINEAANNLVWLGFAAIADPIRPEVPMAINTCRKAGVKVKVITGDNSNTAYEIANQIGLIDPGDEPEKIHITGGKFQAMSNEEALEAVESIKIMSRAKPADKMKMVKLLQQKGEIVAVTGDGTNDAPALNHANVGLAMGISGTSVAKEASDIILLDDSFPSVVKGIMWGRSLYDNIRRFIMFQLTINFVALSIALTGPFIGIEMPLTVVQMLWVNLIMDTFAALALATESPHWAVMARPPRRCSDFIISKTMYKHIFGEGIVFYLILTGILLYFNRSNGISNKELSIFFTAFVFMQVWNMFNARVLGLNSSALKGLSGNKSFVFIMFTIFIGQFLIVQYGGSFFRTESLSLKTWLILFFSTSLVLWVGELCRFFGKKTAPDTSPFDSHKVAL